MPKQEEGSISKRREADWRKELKENIDLLKQAKASIKNKLDKGETLRDQDLRFLEHYPDILRELREKQVQTKEETLEEGKLKTYIERLWKLKEIGKLEDVIEATGYYRCEQCGELHVLNRKCMYEEYKEFKANKEIE